MRITDTALPGVKIIEPTYHEDYRGYYAETYSVSRFAEHGFDKIFVQDNHAYTFKKDTIRGIHFQNNPVPQTKLVRVTAGAIWDVVVDLRSDSPHFKKWIAVVLSAQNKKQIWVPAGFGHAILTLTDDCEVLYKVDNLYDPSLDRAIQWNDPDIAITWPISKPIISQKDINAPFLAESDVNFSIKENGT